MSSDFPSRINLVFKITSLPWIALQLYLELYLRYNLVSIDKKFYQNMKHLSFEKIWNILLFFNFGSLLSCKIILFYATPENIQIHSAIIFISDQILSIIGGSAFINSHLPTIGFSLHVPSHRSWKNRFWFLQVWPTWFLYFIVQNYFKIIVLYFSYVTLLPLLKNIHPENSQSSDPSLIVVYNNNAPNSKQPTFVLFVF